MREEIVFSCPECKGKLKVDRRGVGLRIKCPLCQKYILIPSIPSNTLRQSQVSTTEAFKSTSESFVDQRKEELDNPKGNLKENHYFLGYIVISFLWAFIYGTILSPDGKLFLQKSILSYLIYQLPMGLGIALIVCIISLAYWGIARFLTKSNNKPSFKKSLFVIALILASLSISAAIVGKLDKESTETQSEDLNASLKTQQEKTSLEKLGDTDFYQSAIDNFVAFFPEKPTVETAKSNLVTYKSYQAGEVFENGFIFYSVTFSIDENKRQLAEEKEAYQYLEAIFDEFRKSSGSIPRRHYSQEFKKFLKYPALEYKFDFFYRGIECSNQGLFFINKNRTVRISLSFSKNLESEIGNRYYNFTNTFTIIGN